MPRINPNIQAREDCDDAVYSGANPADMAAPGDNDALIAAMNRDWVLDAAGADPTADRDAEWIRVGLPWCLLYLAAWRDRAAEHAACIALDHDQGESQ